MTSKQLKRESTREWVGFEVLWRCREPHVEPALIYAILPQQLLVFVPQFHIRGAIRLADKTGLVIPPSSGSATGQQPNDAFALAERRKLELQQGQASKPFC